MVNTAPAWQILVLHPVTAYYKDWLSYEVDGYIIRFYRW